MDAEDTATKASDGPLVEINWLAPVFSNVSKVRGIQNHRWVIASVLVAFPSATGKLPISEEVVARLAAEQRVGSCTTRPRSPCAAEPRS